MSKTKLAIIGGSQEHTYQQIGKKMGCEVLFHNGKSRNGGVKKDFRPIIKKADCVVVLLGAIGHVSMDVVKELCKENDKQLVFHQGRGASGAVFSGLESIGKVVA
ncbi:MULTISPECIES: DUF2325 domain-containing protein [unclassified Psychrobacillus]|uniref:DUF2325 domain-containing protein n=1 Tax=unclassified Psychrobacillus TaxID=2636677 RepID=UPI0030F4D577